MIGKSIPWVSVVLYVAAAVLTIGAALLSGLRDLESVLAVIPLLLPVIPVVFVLVADSHRAVIVGTACVLVGAFVYAGSFTVGKAYAPAFLVLLAGGLSEFVIFSRSTRFG